MKKRLLCLLMLLPLCAWGGEVVQWPDLSTVKSVSGRAATVRDVEQGAAAFVLQSDGVNVGQPIDMPIPQYALYTDAETGEVVRAVVVQAEHAMGIDMFGALDLENGGFIISIPSDFELLGQEIDP